MYICIYTHIYMYILVYVDIYTIERARRRSGGRPLMPGVCMGVSTP